MDTYSCLNLKFNEKTPYLLEKQTFFLSDLNFYLYPLYLQKAFKNKDGSSKLILPYTFDDFIDLLLYTKIYSNKFLEEPFDFKSFTVLDQSRLIHRSLQIPKTEDQVSYLMSLLNVIILEIGKSPLGIKVDMNAQGDIKTYIHDSILEFINKSISSQIMIIPLMYSTDTWNHASFIQVTPSEIYIFDPHGNTPLNEECYKMRIEICKDLEKITNKKVYGSIKDAGSRVIPSNILNIWSNPTIYPVGMQYFETSFEQQTNTYQTNEEEEKEEEKEGIGFCNPWCLSSIEKMLKEDMNCVQIQESLYFKNGLEPLNYLRKIDKICKILSERSYKFVNFFVTNFSK